MGIVFFVIGYLVFAWVMGRLLNALLERLFQNEEGVTKSMNRKRIETVKTSTPAKQVQILSLDLERQRHRLNKKLNP